MDRQKWVRRTDRQNALANAVVRCEIKLLQNKIIPEAYCSS